MILCHENPIHIFKLLSSVHLLTYSSWIQSLCSVGQKKIIFFSVFLLNLLYYKAEIPKSDITETFIWYLQGQNKRYYIPYYLKVDIKFWDCISLTNYTTGKTWKYISWSLSYFGHVSCNVWHEVQNVTLIFTSKKHLGHMKYNTVEQIQGLVLLQNGILNFTIRKLSGIEGYCIKSM